MTATSRGLRSFAPLAWLTSLRPLDDRSWEARHRFVLLVAATHVPVLLIGAVFTIGVTTSHFILETLPLIVSVFLAWRLPGRTGRQLSASTAMLLASALVVHLSGGYVEMHFHFFLSLAVVSLYQSRLITLIAIVFVFLHHYVIGSLFPDTVWSNGNGEMRPLVWAAIHAVYVALVALANIVFWRSAEQAQLDSEESYRKLYEGEQAVVNELRQATNMKDELVATVSHEFRTPLASIVGFAELLSGAKVELDATQRHRFSEVICSQAERLSRMVDNLLALSRPEEQVRRGLADLSAVVQEVEIELTGVDRARSRLRVVTSGEALAAIDSDAAHQIVLNLVTNAMKFSPADSPVLVDVSLNGDLVTVQVVNEGPPLSEIDQKRMFDPFVRLDEDSHRFDGAGLGLSIVKRFVAAADGVVQLTCVDDRVHFAVHLPAFGGEPRRRPTLQSSVTP